MIVLFVNFMFANTIFMHMHKDVAGHSILHSHPYLPNSSHSHTSNSLDLINAFNSAAISTDVPESLPVLTPQLSYITFDTPWRASTVVEEHTSIGLRGPPMK